MQFDSYMQISKAYAQKSDKKFWLGDKTTPFIITVSRATQYTRMTRLLLNFCKFYLL